MAIEAILLICGDRNWQAPEPIRALLAKQPHDGRTVVITGGARGADTLAKDLAIKLGHRSICIEAPWHAVGNRAGPLRNRWMLELLRDLHHYHPSATTHVHAFHEHIASSKGTANMVGLARDAGVLYTIHSDVEEL